MLGLKEKTLRGKYNCFSETRQRLIIEEYLAGGLSKRAIWKKHTGRVEDHGLILYWMRKYGYISDRKGKSDIFVSKINKMSSRDQSQSLSDFEVLQLQKRISELEKQLQQSQMQSIAWQTMVEIAEKEFNISIKKKFNTKPSKP